MNRSIGWLVAISLVGCGGATTLGGEAYHWIGRDTHDTGPTAGAMSVRWATQLVPRYKSGYVPVQYASAGLDPKRNRLYAATAQGHVLGFTLNGQRVFNYDAGAGVSAAPAVSDDKGHVFVGADDGAVHALNTDGTRLWKEDVGAAIVAAPALTADAVYVVTSDDSVVALRRSNGEPLWTFAGEPIEEFTIAGHAGLTTDGDLLLTALTDGRVIALELRSGQVYWQIDTSVDIDTTAGDAPDFFDVDTTPAVIDDIVYVASFTGGLYALKRNSGTVLWREPSLSGVTELSASADQQSLYLAGRPGVRKFDLRTKKTLWSWPAERGAPSSVIPTDRGVVLVSETQGSLLALSALNGREVSRIESGNGFTAAAAVAGPIGAALSNGGKFMCLGLR